MLKSTMRINQEENTSATDEVGVAVVGLGYWGPNLLRVLADNLDVSVRWICDLDPERLGKCRRRYPGARATTQVERVLADPAVDAVIIATPVAHALQPGRAGAGGGEARVRREAARSLQRAGGRAGGHGRRAANGS